MTATTDTPASDPVLYESLVAVDLADVLDAAGPGAVIIGATVRTARGRTIALVDETQTKADTVPPLTDTLIGTVAKIPKGRWSEIRFVRYADEGGACWFGEDPAARREGRDGETTRWAKTADLMQLGAVIVSLPRPVAP